MQYCHHAVKRLHCNCAIMDETSVVSSVVDLYSPAAPVAPKYKTEYFLRSFRWRWWPNFGPRPNGLNSPV